MKKLVWVIWAIVCIGLTSYFLYTMFLSEHKSNFLIGEATHGHHQIELSCTSCHTDSFGGGEVLQNACLACHQDDLAMANDSHPEKKFKDPRNADKLAVVDARNCVSCHTEHQKEQTHPMGLTLPKDYCYHCHEDVTTERDSHKDLAFDSCASAGCHNYHDNRALYEEFLVKHSGNPWVTETAKIELANAAKLIAEKDIEVAPTDASEQIQNNPDIHEEWLTSAHGEAGVSCAGCHTEKTSGEWVEKPGLPECSSCHENEVNGFTSGLHGMRLSENLDKPLSPMSPALVPENSHLSFHADALNHELGCNSCHQAHSYDTKTAAVDSCLTCHADDHSQAFLTSPHGELWNQTIAGTLEESQAVSCATCHLPRIKEKINGVDVVRVEHNQNMNLRPNEKMIRPVCMQCHGLEFSIDALADETLIKNNFRGQPSQHIESVDWALQRENR